MSKVAARSAVTTVAIQGVNRIVARDALLVVGSRVIARKAFVTASDGRVKATSGLTQETIQGVTRLVSRSALVTVG